MPARNAARTLERTVSAIPTDVVDEIILVDDSSTDETVDVARRLPLHLIWHPHNVGYGGNQKTCYLEALQRGADVVVMLHPDGQYEPELIPQHGRADRAPARPTWCSARGWPSPGRGGRAGCRATSSSPTAALTAIENRVLGTHFSELHTGYRAFSRELLLTVPFLRNSLDFVFDSELLMQAVALRLPDRGGPGPDPLLRGGLVGSAAQSIVYGVKTLWSRRAVRCCTARASLRSRKFTP